MNATGIEGTHTPTPSSIHPSINFAINFLWTWSRPDLKSRVAFWIFFIAKNLYSQNEFWISKNKSYSKLFCLASVFGSFGQFRLLWNWRKFFEEWLTNNQRIKQFFLPTHNANIVKRFWTIWIVRAHSLPPNSTRWSVPSRCWCRICNITFGKREKQYVHFLPVIMSQDIWINLPFLAK